MCCSREKTASACGLCHKSCTNHFPLPEFQPLEPSLRIINCRETQTNSHGMFQGSSNCISHWKHCGHYFFFSLDLLGHLTSVLHQSPVCQALFLSSKLQTVHFMPALHFSAPSIHGKLCEIRSWGAKVPLWLKDKARGLHFLVCRKLKWRSGLIKIRHWRWFFPNILW